MLMAGVGWRRGISMKRRCFHGMKLHPTVMRYMLSTPLLQICNRVPTMRTTLRMHSMKLHSTVMEERYMLSTPLLHIYHRVSIMRATFRIRRPVLSNPCPTWVKVPMASLRVCPTLSSCCLQVMTWSLRPLPMKERKRKVPRLRKVPLEMVRIALLEHEDGALGSVYKYSVHSVAKLVGESCLQPQQHHIRSR